MKKLIAWWVQNSIAANLLMCVIIVTGVYGYFSLEREFTPAPNLTQITVNANWVGASATDIQEQMISRIEESITGIDGIDFTEARTRESSGTVTITTKLQADYDRVIEEVQARVDGINNLPPDAQRIEVSRNRQDIFQMSIAVYGDTDPKILQRTAIDLQREIAKLPGAELNQILTKLDEEITIEITETQLRRYNLTFNDVAQAVAGSSINDSAGQVLTSAGQLQLRTRNLADTNDEFSKIIIRQTPDGGIVRLSDVARVIDGFEDFNFKSEYKGKPAEYIQINAPDKSNITRTTRAINKYIKEKNEQLTGPITVEVWIDTSTSFTGMLSLIGSNALTGMVLVLILLCLFLRPAVALWVSVGITVAFLGAIAIAPLIGITLNLFSIFAFLLVIGIVVDDAIVVGESVHLHVENGITGERGAIGGANMVAKPVFFAVITTMLAFSPWAFLSVSFVTISEQITFVIVAALTFSLIEAFFILPAHLRHLKPINLEGNNFGAKVNRFQHGLSESLVTFSHKYFRPVAAACVKYRYITFSVFVSLMVISVAAMRLGFAKSDFSFEPGGDMMSVEIRLPEGTGFERVEEVQQQLVDAVQKINDNAKADFGVDYELIPSPGSFIFGTRISANLGLAPLEQRTTVTNTQIEDKFEEYLGDVPDAWRVSVNAASGGGGGGGQRRGVFFGVAAKDSVALRSAVDDLRAQFETYDGVVRTWDNFESSSQEAQFILKPGAEALGITLQDVTRQVREAFLGLQVQRLARDGEDVRVMVRYPKADRDSFDTLRELRIRDASGIEVPLYQVAEIEYAPGVGSITRRDRDQVAYTGATVRGDPEVRQSIMADLNDNYFADWDAAHPDAERLVLGVDEQQEILYRELTVSMFVVIMAMYIMLAIAFRSYFQPLLILIAIPFAFVGMVFGVIVTDVPIGLMSIFGFFAAAGVAINDNLVLIDYINRLRAKGVGAYQSVVDACVARFRPIFLTSLTTFVGITPMLAERSAQAEFLKPVVVALAFGVLFDFFLTLFLVPAMYGMGVDIKRFAKGLWTGEKQPPLGSRYDPDVELVLEDFSQEKEMSGSPSPAAQPAE